MITSYNQFFIEGEEARQEAARKAYLATLPDGAFYRFKVWYNNIKDAPKSRFIEVWVRPKKGETLEFAVAQLPKFLKKGRSILFVKRLRNG